MALEEVIKKVKQEIEQNFADIESLCGVLRILGCVDVRLEKKIRRKRELAERQWTCVQVHQAKEIVSFIFKEGEVLPMQEIISRFEMNDFRLRESEPFPQILRILDVSEMVSRNEHGYFLKNGGRT